MSCDKVKWNIHRGPFQFRQSFIDIFIFELLVIWKINVMMKQKNCVHRRYRYLFTTASRGFRCNSTAFSYSTYGWFVIFCDVQFGFTFLLFRPPVRSNGRSSVLPVMFFFFSPRVLRVPSTDRPETLPLDRNLRVFYNASPKIKGALPQKKSGGQKHAKFRSILDHFRLWSRISPERLKISKIGKRYKLW